MTRYLLLFLLLPTLAWAQGTPSQIVTGSGTVSVDGNQAATSGDVTSNGEVVSEGSTNVFINGKPAATVGSKTNCGGTIVTGSSTVFINGKPMATGGASAVPCPQ
ncbi:MAG: PAAR domain-containing protein [Nitratireductor sp.]|nr:PAAR domain-containing protein [Nitratireductor sp.]MCB1456305.1 PAAR domain-containing protein [Nitratireductor sp.]MCB1458832.1 PAAR domain-containing protein [Nitratireductor sp.]